MQKKKKVDAKASIDWTKRTENAEDDVHKSGCIERVFSSIWTRSKESWGEERDT